MSYIDLIEKELSGFQEHQDGFLLACQLNYIYDGSPEVKDEILKAAIVSNNLTALLGVIGHICVEQKTLLHLLFNHASVSLLSNFIQTLAVASTNFNISNYDYNEALAGIRDAVMFTRMGSKPIAKLWYLSHPDDIDVFVNYISTIDDPEDRNPMIDRLVNISGTKEANIFNKLRLN